MPDWGHIDEHYFIMASDYLCAQVWRSPEECQAPHDGYNHMMYDRQRQYMEVSIK